MIKSSTIVSAVVMVGDTHVEDFLRFVNQSVVGKPEVTEDEIAKNIALIDATCNVHSVDAFMLNVEIHFHPNGLPTFTIPDTELQRLQLEHKEALESK